MQAVLILESEPPDSVDKIVKEILLDRLLDRVLPSAKDEKPLFDYSVKSLYSTKIESIIDSLYAMKDKWNLFLKAYELQRQKEAEELG